MQNYLAIAVFALVGFAAAAPAPAPADGTLTCGPNNSLLSLCTSSRYNCSCDPIGQVSCQNPPDFTCNLGCRCVT